MIDLSLHFLGSDTPELVETSLVHPLVRTPFRCVRGKGVGAYANCSTFQWTKGVQALCLLVLRAKTQETLSEPHLSGEATSLAASLDYAIDKQPSWLSDMLGWDSKGNPLAKRIIRRSNPGRKRNGPVALSLSQNFVESASINIFLDGTLVVDLKLITELCRKLGKLETPFHRKHQTELQLCAA